jgi:hypothetical protein
VIVASENGCSPRPCAAALSNDGNMDGAPQPIHDRSEPAQMPNLLAGQLRIDCSDHDDRLVLEWRGRSTDRSPALTLSPYLRGLYDAAVARKLSVEMHFENLEHFNSSTITALIQLIQEARARQVKLAIFYSGALRWQTLRFEALRVFAKDDLLALAAV